MHRRAFFSTLAGIPFGVVAAANAEAKPAPEIAPLAVRIDTSGHKCHCGSPLHHYEMHEMAVLRGRRLSGFEEIRVSAAVCSWCRAPWLPQA